MPPHSRSPFPSAARIAVALCFFINGALWAGWVSRIPAVELSLGLTHGHLGLVLLAAGLGALSSMTAAGWAVSRYGSRIVSQIFTLASCLVLPLLALAPNAYLLAAALYLNGALYGAMDVAMNAQAVAVEVRYGRPLMSSFHALFSLGGLVGAAVGGLLARLGFSPLRHFTWVAIFFFIVALFVAVPRLLETDEAARHQAQPGSGHSSWPPARLWALGLLAFCIMMGEGSVADWSAVYLRRVVGATESFATMGFAAFSVTMALMRFLGDSLSARLGPTWLVQLGAGLAAAGLALALLLGGAWPALLGFGIVGAGFATIVPQVFSAAGRMPGLAAGPALATCSTIGYAGFLVGPPLIGFAADAAGLRQALGIIVLVSIVALALAPSLRDARGRNFSPDAG